MTLGTKCRVTTRPLELTDWSVSSTYTTLIVVVAQDLKPISIHSLDNLDQAKSAMNTVCDQLNNVLHSSVCDQLNNVFHNTMCDQLNSVFHILCVINLTVYFIILCVIN